MSRPSGPVVSRRRGEPDEHGAQRLRPGAPNGAAIARPHAGRVPLNPASPERCREPPPPLEPLDVAPLAVDTLNPTRLPSTGSTRSRRSLVAPLDIHRRAKEIPMTIRTLALCRADDDRRSPARRRRRPRAAAGRPPQGTAHRQRRRRRRRSAAPPRRNGRGARDSRSTSRSISTLTDQRGGAAPIKRTVTVLAADGYTGSIRTHVAGGLGRRRCR